MGSWIEKRIMLFVFFTFSVILLSHGQAILSPLQPVIAKVGDHASFTCNTTAGTIGTKTALSWERDIHADLGEEMIAMFFNEVSIMYLLHTEPKQNSHSFAQNHFKSIFFYKMSCFKCHWSFFRRVQLTVSQHWFRY